MAVAVVPAAAGVVPAANTTIVAAVEEIPGDIDTTGLLQPTDATQLDAGPVSVIDDRLQGD